MVCHHACAARCTEKLCSSHSSVQAGPEIQSKLVLKINSPPSILPSKIPQRCAKSLSEIWRSSVHASTALLHPRALEALSRPLAPLDRSIVTPPCPPRILQNWRSHFQKVGSKCYKYYNLIAPEKGSTLRTAVGDHKLTPQGPNLASRAGREVGPTISEKTFGAG